MTTRAEEIAAEGPYTSRRHESAMSLRWVIDGPTDPHEWFLSDEQARKECARLNAAYKQGQQERWIPVSSPPEHSRCVIVQVGAPEKFYLTAHYWGEGNGIDGWSIGSVIQWMEIPSPPNP